jgi:small subunit ribosomal protein S17
MSTNKKQSKKDDVKKVKDVKDEALKPSSNKVLAKTSKKSDASVNKVNAVDSKDNLDLKHVLSGEVVSAKMDKTIVVVMERKVKHPVYGKYIKRSSRFFVHDESNKAELGQVVKFKSSKPYSKNKTWVLVD